MTASSLTAVAGPAARHEARALGTSAAWGVASVGLSLLRPWPLAIAVDDALGGHSRFGLGPSVLLVAAGLALVLLTASAGLVEMAGAVAAERAAERIGAQLRHDVFSTSIGLSLRWHDRTRSGELVSRLTTDVGRVLDAVVALCSTLLADAVLLLGVLALLLLLDPELAVIGITVVPVLIVFAVRQRRLVRGAEQQARAESGRFAGAALDLIRNVRAVQAFGRGRHAVAVFAGSNNRLLRANLHAVTTEARWAPMADIVLAAGSGLVLVVGGRQVLSGNLTIGELLVVTTYLSTLYSPVRGISRLSGVLAKSGASADRLLDVLRCDERVSDRPARHQAPALLQDLRFRGVRFAYTAGQPVLDGFDLVVRSGETVCLLGPSGIGKSTVLQLALRLYDVDAGAVQLDGIDIRDVDQDSLHRRIAFVPQDPWLLDATIAENIAFGVDGATRYDVCHAAQQALVTEFADRLPRGLDTLVGEGAVMLSGGQRRRIALARALVSDAPLVLLDEPTASLDTGSAAQVVQALRRAVAGRTALIVTHDRQLAEISDRIVSIRDSRAVPSAIDREEVSP